MKTIIVFLFLTLSGCHQILIEAALMTTLDHISPETAIILDVAREIMP